MSRYISMILVGLTLIVSLFGWGIVWAQGNYFIVRHTFDSSGSSVGGSYTVQGTNGQAEFSTLSGGKFTLKGGFWHADAPDDERSQVFLPNLQR